MTTYWKLHNYSLLTLKMFSIELYCKNIWKKDTNYNLFKESEAKYNQLIHLIHSVKTMDTSPKQFLTAKAAPVSRNVC